MEGETYFPDGVLTSNCWANNCKIKNNILLIEPVCVQLGDLDLLDVELPYRHDLSVILKKMTSTNLETSLYKVINVAMSLFDHERVRDLIFTHGFWGFTNKEVSKLLREAILKGNLNIVRLLLPFNPNLELCKTRDVTPLWEALIYHHEAIAKELIQAGANVNAITKVAGIVCNETPIHFAISEDLSDELIDLLIEHGADINATSKPLQTPLVYAVQWSRLYVIKRLISCGARIDIKSTCGCTLLHIACQSERADEILRILLQYNFDVNAIDLAGANALHYLIRDNPSNIAAGELLLQNGISVVCKKYCGGTPLQDAIRCNERPMVNTTFIYSFIFTVVL